MFFQHGYTHSNIALISRNIGVSRVTIHKQFGSKEQLFKAVVTRYMDNRIAQAKQFRKPCDDFWLTLEQLLLTWCQPAFEEIPNDIIRSDLLHAGTTLCQDVVEKKQAALRDVIAYLIEQGIAKQQVNLSRANLSVEAFAVSIESLFSGLVFISKGGETAIPVSYFFNILKAAVSN
ncbi:transcriptional regulator, TetR family [Thalassotalea agarivorans]|uniref:Transcriptional regulator, TetR family n=1 Tax=Thalassotalea agarivorans TaxID=349064 RepID=A0A1I0AG59_THASX|nr:transcriptional regulator, TetR family [Thalassotalea agarivorans]